MKFFQLAILIFFGFALLIGLLVFAGLFGFGGGKTAAGRVNLTIWGPWPTGAIAPAVNALNDEFKDQWYLTYVAKDPASYESDLVEGLASGQGPDIFVLPSDQLLKNQNKLAPVAFDQFSERQFKSTFAQGGELFLTPTGADALPLVIDPLVLYFNRDLLSSAGISLPPQYWSELIAPSNSLVSRLNKIDVATGKINQSAIALGEFSNIPRAKEIFLTLFLQATGGQNIVTRVPVGDTDYRYQTNLTADFGLPTTKPIDASINFFNQFANPNQAAYSWNRSLPSAPDWFSANHLALHLDFASARPILTAKNPNLNFDVAMVPQRSSADTPLTLARIYGLAVGKNSPKKVAAATLLLTLTNKKYEGLIAAGLQLPPARRDLLATNPSDEWQELFYRAALVARDWWDPDPSASRSIFQSMLQSVALGQLPLEQATARAEQQLANLFTQN